MLRESVLSWLKKLLGKSLIGKIVGQTFFQKVFIAVKLLAMKNFQGQSLTSQGQTVKVIGGTTSFCYL